MWNCGRKVTDCLPLDEQNSHGINAVHIQATCVAQKRHTIVIVHLDPSPLALASPNPHCAFDITRALRDPMSMMRRSIEAAMTVRLR